MAPAAVHRSLRPEREHPAGEGRRGQLPPRSVRMPGVPPRRASSSVATQNVPSMVSHSRYDRTWWLAQSITATKWKKPLRDGDAGDVRTPQLCWVSTVRNRSFVVASYIVCSLIRC